MLRPKLLSLLAVVLVLGGCASSKDMACSDSCAGTQIDLLQNIGDRVFFDTDKARLSPDAQQTLDRQAAWMAQYPANKLLIEGHADERGTREYNLALGERRATAVRNYLVGKGVAASRLATISYGKERPEVRNMNGPKEAMWARNRRAVSVLVQE